MEKEICHCTGDYEYSAKHGVVYNWNTLKKILYRILAVFVASGLGVIGAGSLVGIEVLHSILLAGFLGVASVVESLARAYLTDGKLTRSEIDKAFGSVNKPL